MEGIRSGRSIEFTKSYLAAGPAYTDQVDYSGTMSEDGQSIAGTWFLAELDGTFEMHREIGRTSSEEADAVQQTSLIR